MHKTPREFLLGDIFVYVLGDKRHHFRIIDIINRDGKHGFSMRAELLWVSSGDYAGQGLGYVETFIFSNTWLDHLYEIKKTTPHGCCAKCFGELQWVTMALKCKECGTVY